MAKEDGKQAKQDEQVYTDPRLRERLKDEITAGDKGGKAGQWSARKAQMLTRAYEKAGGGYTSEKRTGSQQDLEEWTDEEWTTRDGQPAIRDKETGRYLPRDAWENLTPAQRRATDEKKRAGSRKGKQHVPNTKAAREARKSA